MHAREALVLNLGRMRRPTATTVSAASTNRPDAGPRRPQPFASKAKRMAAWKLALRDALVDVGGHDLIGHHANAREQV